MPPGKDGIRRSRWAVIRNTRAQLKDTVLKSALEWWTPGILGRWKESEMIFHMEFNDVRAEILFRALDSPEDVQRVLSLEISGCFVEEAREINLDIILALQGRIGRYPRREDVPAYWSGMICSTNPPEVDSTWFSIIEHLPLEENNPDSVMICESWKQPSGLSPEAENVEYLRPNYYSDLAKGKTKAWVDTYVHGLYSPTQSGKPVYHQVFRQDRHVSLTPLKIDPILPVVIGFDTGLTPAAVFKQMGLDGRIRVLREAHVFDMGMKRFAQLYIRPIIKNFFPGNPLIFIGDPAGKRRADSDESSAFKVLKEAFEADDAIVKAASTNDPRVRIQATEQMLSQYPDGEPLMVIDPSCKWYIEALRSKYRFPKIKSTGDYSENPEKGPHSHSAEAGQYCDLYLLSGKYDPDDHVRPIGHNPLSNNQPYRPAQREGY
ncbi:MAG: hypothetical protein WC279_13055 [Sulfurimonas sp.]|jgi:hypothetical protein|uniref:hypothetical protein n=1 Tax=Sulfurimonas sp. TaxID=2022749 RepID=UPI003566E5F0